MEKMVLRRIQWLLDMKDPLDPFQTGFQPHISAHDSLLLIYHDVILPLRQSMDPLILVAIDVKRAFDSVPHSSVIEGACSRGITGRTLRFIEAFLTDRSFCVRVGTTVGPLTPNAIGVPHGSVLSPTIFNLALAGLPGELRQIPELGFTIYADDISIWSRSGSLGHQEHAVQTGLNTTATYLRRIGLSPAHEKTNYIVVGNRVALRYLSPAGTIRLTFEGHVIESQTSLRILGVPIDQDGLGTSWLQLTKTWKATIHLMRRVTSKSWGADERTQDSGQCTANA